MMDSQKDVCFLCRKNPATRSLSSLNLYAATGIEILSGHHVHVCEDCNEKAWVRVNEGEFKATIISWLVMVGVPILGLIWLATLIF